jgi:hypothetical protein
MSVRLNFPEMPKRISSLPVSEKGYPVPFFVSYFDGKPDFRIMDQAKMHRCVRDGLCWICGQKLGRHKAFSSGPLLAVSKLSAEPPSHVDCAVFAAQTCPFMLLPKSKRREANKPKEARVMGGDVIMERNPGATLVWITHSYSIIDHGDDVFFQIGEPSNVAWYSEGKLASRSAAKDALDGSVDASIEKMMVDNPRQVANLKESALNADQYLPD